MKLTQTYRGGDNPPEREIGLFEYFYGLILSVLWKEIDEAKFPNAAAKVDFMGSTTYNLRIDNIDDKTRERIDKRLAEIIIQS